MTRSDLSDAFGHHVWATLRLLDVCQELDREQLETAVPGTYGSILDTMRHLAVDPREPDRAAERVAVRAARHVSDPFVTRQHRLRVPEHRGRIVQPQRQQPAIAGSFLPFPQRFASDEVLGEVDGEPQPHLVRIVEGSHVMPP